MLQQRNSGAVISAIEDRIRKLLALADSPNEHEAAAAAEKAQELMLRHGIELATVAASTHQPLKVDEHVASGKVDPWRGILASAVASSAGGRVVRHPDWQERTSQPGQTAVLWSRRRCARDGGGVPLPRVAPSSARNPTIGVCRHSPRAVVSGRLGRCRQRRGVAVAGVLRAAAGGGGRSVRAS